MPMPDAAVFANQFPVWTVAFHFGEVRKRNETILYDTFMTPMYNHYMTEDIQMIRIFFCSSLRIHNHKLMKVTKCFN